MIAKGMLYKCRAAPARLIVSKCQERGVESEREKRRTSGCEVSYIIQSHRATQRMLPWEFSDVPIAHVLLYACLF